MLICIVGTQCSGKSSVSSYLEGLGFQRIKYDGCEYCVILVSLLTSEDYLVEQASENTVAFKEFDNLLNYVTQNWRQDFVCTSLRTLSALRKCAQRPFFLLVSVDAPVLTRWKRSIER